MTTFEELPPGDTGLLSARPGPDLAAAGYVEREYAARGTAVSFGGHDPRRSPPASRCAGRPRRAPSAAPLVVEWLNVSSGSRRRAGLDLPGRGDRPPRPRVGRRLGPARRGRGRRRGRGSRRRGADRHQGAGAVRRAQPPRRRLLLLDLRLGGRGARRRSWPAGRPGRRHAAGGGGVAVGVRADHLRQRRPSAAAGLRRLPDPLPRWGRDAAGRAGGRRRPAGLSRLRTPTPIRDDLDVPVLMVETETDLFGLLDYLPARQPDSASVRLWEVAGTAHADSYTIGEFEELLGCPRPVNRGQQAYVVRAALRWLDGWARGGDPAPTAARLEVDGRRVRARRRRQRAWRRAHTGRRRTGRAAARRHRAGCVRTCASCSARPCRWTPA